MSATDASAACWPVALLSTRAAAVFPLIVIRAMLGVGQTLNQGRGENLLTEGLVVPAGGGMGELLDLRVHLVALRDATSG